MQSRLRLTLSVLIVVAAASGRAEAQYGRYAYPGGYGGYGWGGWNASDPAAGYMAGLGSYARGLGSYELKDAKAQAINADTIVKWNKAIRQQQRRWRAEQQKAQAQDAAVRDARVREDQINDGTTLNQLVERILEFNPSGIKAESAKAPLSANVIRDIPFESATEAITICLDQMTADDAWPTTLQDSRFAPERQALREAVRKALQEDAKGDVSPATVRRVNEAVAKLRAKFTTSNGEFDLLYADADEFTKGLAGLSGMFTNPKLKEVLAELETYKSGTVGGLLAFMQAFNLRFGPASSDRQREIYHTLWPMLEQVMNDTSGRAQPDTQATYNRTPDKPLPSAARQVFKGMSWQHLNAASKPDSK
ncbi:MAG TPA: hypothetical protein VGZ22_05890 [Isosphaeraceae bacterium]|jgi:hypothetical protein|nr:hypothetical protein [Isosphaeraceae bacterium]